MALHYDLSECVDSKRLTDGEDAWQTTQSMVFATMGCGMGQITAENWPEFYARLTMAGYYGDQITPELVHRYVGLRTNVSYESRAKWVKRVIGNRMDDHLHEARLWADRTALVSA